MVTASWWPNTAKMEGSIIAHLAERSSLASAGLRQSGANSVNVVELWEVVRMEKYETHYLSPLGARRFDNRPQSPLTRYHAEAL